ncbi:hypothetical protein CO611_07095 [Lysobacteraceae bacterium NML03-0222]|nr:hypothetical protein CO611_07095 [Xanthomonadaceae bacterium NML03-0222]
MKRPYILVLAGVNGAGKSSVAGEGLRKAGVPWFNPDTFARERAVQTGMTIQDANTEAWHEGVRRLDAAISAHQNYAFETTLGGNTIAAKLRQATGSHDVLMWLCGLDSVERHIARVRQRVRHGGHDIPEKKIRQRWHRSIANLIALLPHLRQLHVYDNSQEAPPGSPVPDPHLLLFLDAGRIRHPNTHSALHNTPDWAKPIMEAALSLAESGHTP